MTPTARELFRQHQSRLLHQGLLPALCRWLPTEPLQAFEAQRAGRRRLFSPLVTLWAMIAQVVAGQVSQATTARYVSAWLGRRVAPRSGSFAKARARLPGELLAQLAREVAQRVPGQRRSRRAWLLDVTCLTLADTPANRERWPQAAHQRPGCGFPLLKVAVLMDARSGAVLAWTTGTWRVHDSVLARPLWEQLPPGSLLVADRAFASLAFLAALAARGVDVVVRQHQARVNQRPRAVGDWDETWTPSRDEARAGTPQLRVRVVAHELPNGKWLLLNTTLSRRRAGAAEVARLYADRWRIETQFAQLKGPLACEQLDARTPASVERAVASALLALNLLCAARAEAARVRGGEPSQWSLASLLAALDAVALTGLRSPRRAWAWVREQLGLIPARPGRHEPRVKKRRPKQYPLMTQPRAVLKAGLAPGRA